MADEVNIDELDASDLADILTEVKGVATKVKNAVAGRKELAGLLAEKNLLLQTDEEGNFVLNPKKAAKTKAAAAPAAKAKTKAAAKPEPEEEDEEEEDEEETEEEDEETEEEEEEETEEEDEEEEESEDPAPKTKAKAKAPAAKPAPAKPAPKAKAKAKAEPEDEEEDEEEEVAPKKGAKAAAPAKTGAKRAPPTREPSHGNDAKITVGEDRKFKADSIRHHLWVVMKKSKTVGDFMTRASKHEREDVQATARGFLNVAVKDGWITVQA